MLACMRACSPACVRARLHACVGVPALQAFLRKSAAELVPHLQPILGVFQKLIASKVGSPLARSHRDWAPPSLVCPGTGRGWAHPRNTCADPRRLPEAHCGPQSRRHANLPNRVPPPCVPAKPLLQTSPAGRCVRMRSSARNGPGGHSAVRMGADAQSPMGAAIGPVRLRIASKGRSAA